MLPRKNIIDTADFLCRVDLLMARLGITKVKFAEIMGVHRSGIVLIRSGERRVTAHILSRFEAIESGAITAHSATHRRGMPCKYSYSMVVCAENRDFRMRTDIVMARMKINQGQLAEKMGFSYALINFLRNGRRKVSARAIQRLEYIEKESKKWFTAT